MSPAVRPIPRHGGCRRPPRAGFTLVELLVVIGVVAVLVGLLLPVLATARRNARRVTCSSNLGQWAKALIAFAAQNDGAFPRRGQGVQPTTQVARGDDWFNALPRYLGLKPYSARVSANDLPRPGGVGNADGGSGVWLCPSAVDLGAAYHWSYSMNMALSVEQANQNAGQPDKLTTVGDATSMVFMADGPGNYCSTFPSKTPGNYNPAARHEGAVNLSFVDGHVAAYRGQEVGVGTGVVTRADVRWHPPNNSWNSAQ